MVCCGSAYDKCLTFCVVLCYVVFCVVLCYVVLCCVVVPLSPTYGSIPVGSLIYFPSILGHALENRVGTLKA